MDNRNITVLEFVSMLMPVENVLEYGRTKGWLEDEDQRFPDNLLNRRTAARILHQFMRIEKGIPDVPDISRSEGLRDLYTCRICANHIAQIYVRGIMTSVEVEHCGKIVQIFDHMGLVTEKEAVLYISRIKACN